VVPAAERTRWGVGVGKAAAAVSWMDAGCRARQASSPWEKIDREPYSQPTSARQQQQHP
jgi:hypothetical protein